MYIKSEVAASRSEVIPYGIVKLLLRSSEVKYSAYRAEGTLHARSALHLRSILHVPLAEHLVQKKNLCLHRQSSGHYMHLTYTNIVAHTCKYFNSEVAAVPQ